tara:strand:+ start:582 stop:1262 length:681 start_codon:yes stop_codon:yes gene_type:complete
MKVEDVRIHESWKNVLKDEFQKPYFMEIKNHLLLSKSEGKTVYPPGSKIFNAFDSTHFNEVKVVIVGQDPYHGPGEAMGLSFSVPRGKRIPPSLLNIYKEMKEDLGYDMPRHGDLSSWADQGVFLLNSILTVEHKLASSHKKIGWMIFTDAVISQLSNLRKNLIFMLWGKFAQSKSDLIDQTKHHVLQAPHPSPLARGGYFGSKHFSKANDILTKTNQSQINWKIE